MQLVDELSMIYTTMLSCFSSFSHKRSRSFTILLALFLVGLAVYITAYYHYIKDPKFHQRAYAILTATVLIRNMIVMELHLRPSNKRRRESDQRPIEKLSPMEKRERQRTDARDMKILSTMWAMIATGLSVFLGGFAIWQLDNVYCSNLRQWRRHIGLPWGIVLEGHGWW
jgi:dihydroceramidase